MPQYLTEQELQDYGPEFIDVVRRVAAEIAAPLQTEVQNLRGQLGFVERETSNAFLTRMNSALDAALPGWRDLNRDPDFIAWVQLPETYSGVVRQQLMQEAWNNGDANRVLTFFRAYLAGVGGAAPSHTAYQRVADRDANYYTPSQIQKFYTDVAAGKWAGREELRKSLDADIQRASVEDRIVADPKPAR